MARKPKPFTPPECDLRGLPYMPLHGDRLIDSDLFFMTSGDEFKAALALWWASWKQHPAASLPTEPRVLAGLARVSDLAKWEQVREGAMHGWVLCSDNRYYHRVVADLAILAWEERQEYQQGKEAETERKRRERDERKLLFAGLKALGVHLAWNVSLAELRLKASEAGVAPVQGLSAGQVADRPAPVTAIEGTGRGRGMPLEGSDDPSLSAGKPSRVSASPKRSPEEPIPAGFPDAAAITDAEGWIAAAGVTLDAAAHARRFANHAATKDRRERNWLAAWRAWVDIEIETAPAAQAAKAEAIPFEWNGPADVWKMALTQGEPWARGYVGRCSFRDGALVTTSPTLAKGIRQAIGHELSAKGVAVVIEPAAEQGRAA